MKKPLKNKSTKRAVNNVAKMVKVVVKTVQPNGTSSEQIELAACAVEKLRKTGKLDVLDETTLSLIEHFQDVSNREIKRGLLGEISKKLSFLKLTKLVKSKVTRYE